MQGGHYTATVRAADELVYDCNDSRVAVSKSFDFKDADAYVLSYSAMSSDTASSVVKMSEQEVEVLKKKVEGEQEFYRPAYNYNYKVDDSQKKSNLPVMNPMI